MTDSDNDGLADDAEEIFGKMALNPDTDADGLLDGVETGGGVFMGANNTGTNPLAADTDGDGFRDGNEVDNGTDPNDPFDPAQVQVPVMPVLGLLLMVFGILVASLLESASRRGGGVEAV